jgi:kumamolisin
MIKKLSIFVLTIVAMVLGANVVCQAQPQTLLTRHVREATMSGQAKSVGRLPAKQLLSIDVVLPLRDKTGLESFLQELYDPSSPFYRNFLTVQEFTARYGPTQENYDAFVQFAKVNGFTVVGGSRDAMNVQLKGTVGTIEAAFHVTLGLYHDPIQNRDFYAPDREPSIDLPFQLWHISGLDNYSIPRPAFVRRSEEKNVQPPASIGSCPQASFCGSDMRAAYYGGTSLTGTNQNIGLLEYAGFNITDVNTYYTNAHQTRAAAVTGISTDGTSINCVSPSCDDTEQTIDITQSLGMAPGITTDYIYVGSSDTALLGGMSSGTPLPSQLSSSWLWDPSDPSTDNPYFLKMAAQGQSFFQASGDDAKFNSNYPTWPCDAAYVTSVGGTDLETVSAGGAWKSETAWSQSGGGYWVPDDISIPNWQQFTGVINSANQGSTVYRNAPDVAANANFTYYVCANQTTCTANDYGGTSFAAPLWAGYLALTNQQGAANGNALPGFINPNVYSLALSSNYATGFHDITSGSNGYPAVTGYDLVTGWGSMNGSALIGALLAAAPNFAINASPNEVSVSDGGTITSTITTAGSNGFDSAITLSSNYAGVTFSPNSIPAPGTGSSTLTAKIPTNTKPGTYTVVIFGKGGNGKGRTAKTAILVTVTQ